MTISVASSVPPNPNAGLPLTIWIGTVRVCVYVCIHMCVCVCVCECVCVCVYVCVYVYVCLCVCVCVYVCVCVCVCIYHNYSPPHKCAEAQLLKHTSYLLKCN